MPDWSQILAQAVAPAGAASAAAGTQIHSVWDFVVKGGPVMIPIGLLSVVVVTLAIERLISLRRGRIIPPGFLPGLKAMLSEHPQDMGRALKHCETHPSPISTICAAALLRSEDSPERQEQAILQAGEREVFKLQKFLRWLAVITNCATMLGLLGTIFGMINAFATVAASGDALGRTELLAKGIYEAMITTAAGLILAIPTLVTYHFFMSRVDGLVAEMDRQVVQVVEEHRARLRVPQPPRPLRTADGPNGDGRLTVEPASAPVAAV